MDSSKSTSERYAKDLLFTDGMPIIEQEQGYRGNIAATAAGITYRQLDYWARTNLVSHKCYEGREAAGEVPGSPGGWPRSLAMTLNPAKYCGPGKSLLLEAPDGRPADHSKWEGALRHTCKCTALETARKCAPSGLTRLQLLV